MTEMIDSQKKQTDTTNIDTKYRKDKHRDSTDRQNRIERQKDRHTEKTDIQTEKTDKQTIDRDLEVRICASLHITIDNKMNNIFF